MSNISQLSCLKKDTKSNSQISLSPSPGGLLSRERSYDLKNKIKHHKFLFLGYVNMYMMFQL